MVKVRGGAACQNNGNAYIILEDIYIYIYIFRSAEASGQNTANKRPAMFEMLMADGTTLQVPTDWAMYMAAVDKNLGQIEESTRLIANSIHQPNANSARWESAENIA